jgi:hypothetical protein
MKSLNRANRGCPLAGKAAAGTKRTGTLNPHPAAVSDPLFRENPFFGSKDLLQVRYEMLLRHRVKGASVVDVSSVFGVSRPTFYQAQAAFERGGLTHDGRNP